MISVIALAASRALFFSARASGFTSRVGSGPTVIVASCLLMQPDLWTVASDRSTGIFGKHVEFLGGGEKSKSARFLGLRMGPKAAAVAGGNEKRGVAEESSDPPGPMMDLGRGAQFYVGRDPSQPSLNPIAAEPLNTLLDVFERNIDRAAYAEQAKTILRQRQESLLSRTVLRLLALHLLRSFRERSVALPNLIALEALAVRRDEASALHLGFALERDLAS